MPEDSLLVTGPAPTRMPPSGGIFHLEEHMELTYRNDFHVFMLSPLKNTWWIYEDFKAYVRKSFRCFNGVSYLNVFDVASVEVTEELRGNGIFTHWLYTMEAEAKKAGFNALHVESLLNPQLAKFLEKRGYILVEPSMPPCYFLPLT